MADNGSNEEKISPVVGALAAKVSGLETETYLFRNDTTILVPVDKLVAVMEALKNELGFELLVDMAGIHYPGRPKCFEVAYVLRNVQNPDRIRIKVQIAEEEKVPSVTGVWPAANWHEREAYDMLGIVFEGHPDLTRIFMDDDFEHHPLRKEFPLKGFN